MVEKPQPLLGKRQREAIGRLTGAGRSLQQRPVVPPQRRRLLAEPLGKESDLGRFKEQFERHFTGQLAAHARHHLRCQQRMATQRKEIVIHPHPFKPQHRLPNGRQLRFQRRARGHKLALCRGIVRGRQRLAVDFAIRRQRQRF